MEAIMMVGISSSGKSTLAEEMSKKMGGGALIINRDDIRFQTFCNGERDWGKYRFTKERERTVTEIQEALIGIAAAKGRNLILSDTNLNQSFRLERIRRLIDLGYTVKEHPVDTEFEKCFERNRRRGKLAVPNEALFRQARQMRKYMGQPVHEMILGKQPAIVVDVDGTVADMTNRRPFEWDKVDQDLPRDDILSMVTMYQQKGTKIVFLSGRDACCYGATYDWLADELGNENFELFMRPRGDHTNDAIIKEKMFFEHVDPKYNVRLVIDDRPRVVRMWHRIDIQNVIAVANPYIEF